MSEHEEVVPVEDDWDDDEDDWDDENTDFLYIKYMFEGIPSLPDLATAFRAYADDLDERAVAGWYMDHPVDGGHVHLYRDPAGTW